MKEVKIKQEIQWDALLRKQLIEAEAKEKEQEKQRQEKHKILAQDQKQQLAQFKKEYIEQLREVFRCTIQLHISFPNLPYSMFSKRGMVN